MRKLVFSGFLILFLFQILFGQGLTFHGNARNSIYSYDSNESHTRFYQYLNFSVQPSNKIITLNTSLRALTDSREAIENDKRFKAYLLNFRLDKLLQNRLELVIGRQFLYPGTVLGGLDGVLAKTVPLKNTSLQLYAGTESPYLRNFKISKTDERLVYGGMFQIQDIVDSRIQILYLQKSSKEEAFWQISGVNVDTKILPQTSLRLQSHYDLLNERMHRLLFQIRHYWSSKLLMNIAYKQQHPQIYANSFYTIFEPKAYRQLRVGGSFEFYSNYFIQLQYQRILFEDEGANRAFLTLQNRNGSIGLLYENGYAGDQLGLMFDYAYDLMPNLAISVYVDYSKYRAEEVYEYDNQLANAARLSYRLGRNWDITVEYQWLTNRFKESDSRFLNHISYRW